MPNVDDDWEDAYCADESAKLLTALTAQDLTRVYEMLADFCHEGCRVTMTGRNNEVAVSLCSIDELAYPVVEFRAYHPFRKGQTPQGPPPTHWPAPAQEALLRLGYEVLARLRNGQTGC